MDVEALKAAIAKVAERATAPKAPGPNTTKGPAGRRVSKTHDAACSAAMSAWKRGQATPHVFAALARCRALAKGRMSTTSDDRKKLAEKIREGRKVQQARKEGTFQSAERRKVAEAVTAYHRGKQAKPTRGVETREERINRLLKRSDDRLNATAKRDGWTDRAEVSWRRSATLQRMRSGDTATQARAKHSQAVERTRAQVAKTRAERAAKEVKPNSEVPDAGFIGRVRVADIQADPKRFQYKTGLTDTTTGTTEGLKDIRHWNEELAGVISVWRDPSNKQTYVINGHHRLALAQRLGVGDLPVRYIHAADATEARAKGALQNIAEGRGTTLDAAKFFRDTRIDRESLQKTGLSMREKQIDTALGAAKVAGPVWHETYNERLNIEHAALIGHADLPPSSQVAILKDIQGRQEKNKAVSHAYIKEAIDDEQHAPSKTETTAGLFGDMEEERRLSSQAREFRASVMERLGKDKRIFGAAARNSARLETGGNKIDVATSEAIAKESGTNAEAFQAWKRHPSVKRVIDDAVLKMAETKDRKQHAKIDQEAYDAVVKKIKGLLGA